MINSIKVMTTATNLTGLLGTLQPYCKVITLLATRV